MTPLNLAAAPEPKLSDTGPFDDQPLHELVTALRRQLSGGVRAQLCVPHPDLALQGGRTLYPGERFELAGRSFRHRPLRLWLDLAERLGCRLRLPEPLPPHRVRLTFERLGPEAPWHRSDASPEAKYGAASPFQRLEKLEEPRFLLDLLDALEGAALPPGGRVLSLGVNRGDELDAFALFDPELAAGLDFVAVDHAASALSQARARYPDPRHRFLEGDVDQLDTLALGRFDLVLALGLLQSPGVDDRALLRALVQRHVGPEGALILAVPNGRYRDGELLYGARTKNYSQPELGLLIRDLAFYRRYLQQHRFRVRLMGKHDVLVVARRVRSGP